MRSLSEIVAVNEAAQAAWERREQAAWERKMQEAAGRVVDPAEALEWDDPSFAHLLSPRAPDGK